MKTPRHRRLAALAGVALLAPGLAGAAVDPAPTAPAAAVATAVASAAAAPRPVKVMVINLFGMEAAPWIKALQPTDEIRVPGLSAAYPLVRCTPDGVCQMTTDMGHANAAASLMAVLFSGRFDLHETYFLVAGIAGIDPGQGTIGTVAWARYVVDGGIAHEIDAREMPRGWHDGYFGILTHSPETLPALEYHSEVFRLDERLLQKALEISAPASLRDSPGLASYRSRYREAAARRPPRVTQCDTLSADTWWAGRRLGERASRWTRLVTEGKGVYCTSQEEDNAVMVSLTRGAQAGLIDLTRVAVLRSGSDFDRPYPGQGVLESLRTQLALPDAFAIAADNLVITGLPVVQAIVRDWQAWRGGVPASARAPSAHERGGADAAVGQGDLQRLDLDTRQSLAR